MSLHLRHHIVAVIALLSMTSCRTVSRVGVHDAITVDTTHITMTDTTRRVTVIDTIIYHTDEVITEHIITRYDPVTGQPDMQQTDRIIRRMADSIVTHLRDSLLHGQQVTLDNHHTASEHDEQHYQSSPTSPISRFISRVQDLLLAVIIIMLIYVAISYYRRGGR